MTSASKQNRVFTVRPPRRAGACSLCRGTWPARHVPRGHETWRAARMWTVAVRSAGARGSLIAGARGSLIAGARPATRYRLDAIQIGHYGEIAI